MAYNALAQFSDKSCEFQLIDGSTLNGELYSDDALGSELIIVTGDTLFLPHSAVKKRFQVRDHFSYEKGKFHHKTGSYLELGENIGAREQSSSVVIDLSYYKRFTPRVHLGAGLGYLSNFRIYNIESGALPTTLTINHQSVPLFAAGKYFITQNQRRIYTHAKLGYTLGVNETFNQNISDNGFMANYGIGVSFASRWGLKSFFEINQQTSYGSGTSFSWDISGPVNSEYEMWFNNIAIAVGIEINLITRRKRF